MVRFLFSHCQNLSLFHTNVYACPSAHMPYPGLSPYVAFHSWILQREPCHRHTWHLGCGLRQESYLSGIETVLPQWSTLHGILLQVLTVYIFTIRSRKQLNSEGDRMHPCLTPVFTSKASEVPSVVLTRHLVPE